MPVLAVNPSVDRAVFHAELDRTWAQLIAGAGTGIGDSMEDVVVYMFADSGADRWRFLARAIFIFDTSSLPDNCVVTGAVLKLFGNDKFDNLSIAPDINVYSASPASESSIVAGDFDSLGSTPYCDTAITYANWTLETYNEFVLNATGIAVVSKTGNTILGVRNANYDVAAVAPSWSSPATPKTVLGTLYSGNPTDKPQLVITYDFLGLSQGIIID